MVGLPLRYRPDSVSASESADMETWTWGPEGAGTTNHFKKGSMVICWVVCELFFFLILGCWERGIAKQRKNVFGFNNRVCERNVCLNMY